MIGASLKSELFDLVGALCNGSITSEEQGRLGSLLSGNGDARQFYVRYLDLHLALTDLDVLGYIDSDDVLPGLLAGLDAYEHEDAAFTNTLSHEQDDSSHSAVPTFPTVLNATVGYFSDGMPLAYLLATVITGLGLLVMGLVHVSGPEQVARQSISIPSPASGKGVEGEGKVVGRITGAVGCKWAEKGTVPFCPRGGLSPFPRKGSGFRGQRSGANNQQSTINNHQSLVSLGQNFALASGLLEITYHTGAKVILQGPATYEVEANGGYLSIGKLTGKLEKGNGKARMTNDEGLQNSSFVIRPSPFVIHTSTATVTDLGTEFGVNVGEHGSVAVVVFDGKVKVADSQQRSSRVVTVGEAIEVRSGSVAQVKQTGTAFQFVRAIRPTTPSQGARTGLVFSYDFEPPLVKAGYLLGQDGWTGQTDNETPFRVTSGTGANCSQVIAGIGNGEANCRRFKWTRDWLRVAPGTIVTEEFWVYAARPERAYLVMGGWWAGDSSPAAGVFGISDGKWYVREAAPPAQENAGDGGIKANHWYDVKLVIDFSVPGGLATLYQRDVTAGEKTFIRDNILRDVEMRIPPVPWGPPAGWYEIMGISVRSGGSGVEGSYFDNFSIRIDRSGEASPPNESEAPSKTKAVCRSGIRR
jgi:hypothetical protein